MNSVKDVLVGFMREMNAWEVRCRRRTDECIADDSDFEDAMRIGIEEYMEIFQKYCSPTRGKPRDFHYTTPPDYDPEKEVIKEVNHKSSVAAEVRTQQNYSHRKRHVYRLVLEEGQWRLHAKGILLDNGDELPTSL